MTRLLVENVTRKFGGVTALNQVSLEVSDRSILGLIGPNGSGKTTMLNLISGTDSPTAGTISLDERPIHGMPFYRRVRVGVARTFQHVRLIPDLTAAENVAIAVIDHELSVLDVILQTSRSHALTRARLSKAKDLLAFVGCAEQQGIKARELSYGDRRRVEIARALASKPRVLLLDEPAAGMTPGERHRLRTLMPTLRDQGLAIVLVEHDMDLVSEVCDIVQVLVLGRTLAIGQPEEIRRNDAVIDAYLGHEHA